MEQQYTVLLVEDEVSVALPLSKALEQDGFRVLTAGDGDDGLRIALKEHPDVILTDLKMPKMSGMEMIGELRKDEWGKQAEIIILTNVSDVQVVEEAMSKNAFFYIVKGDSTMAEVIAKVHSRLKP